MAHYKRKRQKTFRYPTCPGGMHCRYDVYTMPTCNIKERRTYKDYKQPQMYPEQEIDWDDPDMNGYSLGDISWTIRY